MRLGALAAKFATPGVTRGAWCTAFGRRFRRSRSERRAASGPAHVARVKELQESERETIVAEVMSVLDDARLAGLFAADARAEFPSRGILADGRRVSGVVTPRRPDRRC